MKIIRRKRGKGLGFIVSLIGAVVVCSFYFVQLSEAEQENIILNPSAEEGKTTPNNWNVYKAGGECEWGISTTEHNSGEKSAFLTATKYMTHKGRQYINIALVAGNSGGYSGPNAYKAKPDTKYSLSFWIKGDVKHVNVYVRGFKTEKAEKKSRQTIATTLRKIVPTDTWMEYKGSFFTNSDTKKFILMFSIHGYEDDGMNLGTIYVDDVKVNVKKAGGINL